MGKIVKFAGKALASDIKQLQNDLSKLNRSKDNKLKWKFVLDDFHLCSWNTTDVTTYQEGTLIEAFKKAKRVFGENNGTDYLDISGSGIQIALVCFSGYEVWLPKQLWEKTIHEFLRDSESRHWCDDKKCRIV